MDLQELLEILQPIIAVLDGLEINYRLGGSVVSSHFGQSRQTNDVDLVADIQPHHVPSFVNALDPDEYLVVDQTIRDAIRYRSSFNIIALQSMTKIDIFIPKQTPLAQQEQARAQPITLEPGMPPLWITSVEDMILEKILWWQMGGGISDRQWQDIIHMIRRQAPNLDRAYLQTNAATLQITPILQQVFADAGVPLT